MLKFRPAARLRVWFRPWKGCVQQPSLATVRGPSFRTENRRPQAPVQPPDAPREAASASDKSAQGPLSPRWDTSTHIALGSVPQARCRLTAPPWSCQCHRVDTGTDV